MWNDLLVALVFADTRHAAAHRRPPEPDSPSASNIDVLAPGAFLSLVVPLVVFFAFQRYFVQGIAGSQR